MTETSANKGGHVDSVLVNKAVSALLKHHEKATEGGKQLLGTDIAVQVQIGLDQVPHNPSPRPIRVMIPNPIHRVKMDEDSDGNYQGLEEPDVCIIVKEESKPWVQEMISNFPDHMGCVKKVLGLQSLRKKYMQFEQKRELLHKYDMFLADDRILPMLAKCLGKNFFKTKKQPVPIRLTRKEALPLAIRNCLSATFMFMSAGTCLTIRAGNTGMPCTKLAENVDAIAANAVKHVPRKWANVRSISVKTADSTSLPIYNKTPEELMEIAKMAGIERDHAVDKIESKETKEVNDTKSKKRKQELASRSPLIRALKKQKESDEKERGNTEKKKKRQRVKDETETSKKSVSKGDKKEEKQTPVVEAVPSKEKKKKTPTSKENVPTKNKDETADSSSEKKEQKKFIASKKFKGSKPGYVFRTGSEGVGYYVDIKPIPDKMALAAFARVASSPGRGPGKRAGGKRRGRR